MSSNNIPLGYRPLAWMGLIGNLIFEIALVVIVILMTFSGDITATGQDPGGLGTAINYLNFLLSMPLSIIGVWISFNLIKRNVIALSFIKPYFITGIILNIASIIAELRFNLDMADNSFIELSIGAFEVLVNAATLAYWDRTAIKSYLLAGK